MTNEEAMEYKKYDDNNGCVFIGTEQFLNLVESNINSIQENTKLKAEIEQLKAELHQLTYRNCLQCLNYGKCSINDNYNISYCSDFKLKGQV